MDNHIVRSLQIRMGQIYTIEGEAYRLFYVSASLIGAISMTHNEISVFDTSLFSTDVTNGTYQLKETNTIPVANTISETQRQRIDRLKPIMDGLLRDMYPVWNLISKSGITVPALARAAEAAGMGRRSFRRRFYTYLRSGCDETSLSDGRSNKRVKDIQTSETGTVLLQEPVTKKQIALEHALKVFKEKLNVNEAYLDMIEVYYSHSTSKINELGGVDVYIRAEDDAPGYHTVYRYISRHLGGRTVSEYIRGEKENRNNHRILTGTQQSGVAT